MRIRIVAEDFEARLLPTEDGGCPGASGKIERKSYRDGSEKLKLKASDLAIPDGESVDVLIDDELIGTVIVGSGRCRMRMESGHGEPVPSVQAGTRVVLRYHGADILGGIFKPD